MDFMELVNKYLIEQALVMIPVLLIIAWVIRKTEKLQDRWIPVILLGFSLAFTPILLGGFSADNIVQAFLVTGGEMLAWKLYEKTLGYSNYKEDVLYRAEEIIVKEGMEP